METLAETGPFYGGSDDDDLPTIEEIVYTTLQKNAFTTEDSSLENTARGVEQVALEERGRSIDHRRMIQAAVQVSAPTTLCRGTDSNFL